MSSPVAERCMAMTVCELDTAVNHAQPARGLNNLAAQIDQIRALPCPPRPG